MKKLITFIWVVSLFNADSFAQKKAPFNYDYEIIYQYTFKPNKADTTKLSEKTVLFCTDDEFYFASIKNYEFHQSVYEGRGADLLAQVYSGSQKSSSVSHHVFSKGNIVTTLEIANNRSFSYEEKPKLKWVILPDTTTVKGYSCQRAELKYGGRTWLAWFSAEIPLSMGPYKFNGLPGLILTIADDQDQFNWELANFNKVKTSIPWVYFYNTKNHEQVTKKEYFDYRIKRIEDPYTYDVILNPKIGKVTSTNPEATRRSWNKKVKSKLFEDNWIEVE